MDAGLAGASTRKHYRLAGGYGLVGPHAGDGYSAPLTEVAPGILTDGRSEYPVVDGIPYLLDASTRPGLERARERACELLRRGDERAALRLLLRDQDRFSPTAPPSEAAVDALIDGRDTLSLREAMALLNYGPVADYFAYRWSSPTFQSGLALLERAGRPHQPLVEVACGIGHFLRHAEGEGRAVVGVDIVFSKLWLARHFLGVTGPLVCGDIERSAVLALGGAEIGGSDGAARSCTVFCHDAFYFFEDKPSAYAHLRALAGEGGTVVLGHVHTRTDAHEAGFAERLTDYRQLLPTGAALLDDVSLACAFLSRDDDGEAASAKSTAFALVDGPQHHAHASWIPARDALRLNPLLTSDGLAFPSAGWRREFEEDSEPLGRTSLGAFAKTRRVQALVNGDTAIADLGEEEAASLYRHRVLLNLPARW